MLQVIYDALNALLLVAIGVSAAMWVVLVRGHWGQRPAIFLASIVPSRPRQRPFWTPLDVLVMVGMWIVVGQLMMAWMIGQGLIEAPATGDEAPSLTADALLASIAASSIAGLSATGIAILWLRLFDRDACRKLGLTFNAADLGLGLKASLMILPPVMLIASAVSYFVPYQHQVLDSLAKMSTPAVFAATFVATAIVTPLFEEFLVRVLLQGGLQGMADRNSEGSTTWRPRAYWPVVASSLIFAVLHIGGQGAAPIPLFALALGLGYLYRQTGCIIAPLIVHMVLNSITLVVEMVRLQTV